MEISSYIGAIGTLKILSMVFASNLIIVLPLSSLIVLDPLSKWVAQARTNYGSKAATRKVETKWMWLFRSSYMPWLGDPSTLSRSLDKSTCPIFMSLISSTWELTWEGEISFWYLSYLYFIFLLEGDVGSSIIEQEFATLRWKIQRVGMSS